jgi:predicted ATPase
MLVFTKLSLKNWKNFGNVKVSLFDRMFVVGANASGKSNFLDAFRFLKDVVNNGLQKAVNSRGGIKKIRNLNARAPSYVEISVSMVDNASSTPDTWEYTIQFNAAGGSAEKRDINISLEKIIKNNEIILDRKYTDENEDYLSKQFTHLEQPAINGRFRVLFDCFKSISYVNIIPQLIREADSFIPSNATEDFYGRNLLETISVASEKTRNTKLRSINRVLKMAVPQFSDLAYVVDEKGRPHLQVKYEHFRPKGAYQREDQFSDGTLRLFGIIWAILDGDGLMLLEEPELYLHSEIVKQLPMFIANAQKLKNGLKRQVIISSHSYDLLNTDTISTNEIIILRQDKEDTSVELANVYEEVNIKINAGYTPADAVIPHVAPKGIENGQLSLFEIN